MSEFNLLKIIDKIFALKPGEQKLIKKEIEKIQSGGSDDKNKS
jgi:hypothetical protein